METSSEADYEVNYDESTPSSKLKRQVEDDYLTGDEASAVERVFVEPPHICTRKRDDQGNERVDRCHVYTEDTEALTIHATLGSATNKENDTHSAEWCNYPLGKIIPFPLKYLIHTFHWTLAEGFQCQIPKAQAQFMIRMKKPMKCKPMVECEVIDPYDSPGSVLAESQCMKVQLPHHLSNIATNSPFLYPL